MSKSLDNHAIRQALVQRGFRDITSQNRVTKSWRLQHPQMRHWVSIKLAKNIAQPMATTPLVVHPDDARLIRAALVVDAGITVALEPFGGRSTQYDGIHGYAVSLADIRAVDAFVAVVIGAPRSAADPQSRLASLSASDYAQALVAKSELMTVAQRAMLIGHARSPGHRLSMESIALHGGYDSYTAANSQYGRLGRLLAQHFGIEGLQNQTLVIAQGIDEPDAQGHFVWLMRPRLVGALHELGWVNTAADERAALASAAADLDQEDIKRSATTRQALIYARLGQGLYREQMLDVWRQRCAVTGCGIRSALIASHAQAWKSSTDTQRLDPYNGLLLTASIDRLFDQGLIGFSDDGCLLRKEGLSDDELIHLGLRPGARLRADLLHSRHAPYLAAHRAKHHF